MKQDLEQTTRQRLRALRLARGWSLDELSRRAHIGASTISRIETGHRRIALDQLVSLAKALGASVDDLLDESPEDQVVIKPTRNVVDGTTHWLLTRADDPLGRTVTKTRLPTRRRGEARIHPGREWLYVLDGTARLLLGDREHIIQTGEAAEFDTMVPHLVSGHGGPVEILSIFDRQGERAHLTSSTPD
ncbi:MAG: helix-turn-helix domain-containing protein [Actinomycetota bacterium]